MTPADGPTPHLPEEAGPPALVRAVLAAVRRTGTHGLPGPLLDRLAAVRSAGVADPRLATFPDSVLARRDGTSRNRTHLALALLEHLLADPAPASIPTGSRGAGEPAVPAPPPHPAPPGGPRHGPPHRTT